MFETLNFVALLLTILVSCPESETANVTAFITNSSSPSYAVEGQSFTLEWTYTLDGTVRFVQFSIITSSGSELPIGRKFGTGVITIESEYQARFRAQATNTRAELNILTVQKSDETTFRVNIIPSGSGSLSQLVVVIVYFQPTITEISAKQTVIERENVTLQCLPDGVPKPNITWTRLSDNRVVNMPLTDIRRQDAGKYRCTADNGVGSPSTEDVLIVVQYKPDNVSLTISTTKVCAGVAVVLTCSAGAANPAVQNYTLYKFVEGLTEVSSNQVGIFIQKLYTKGQHSYRCEGSSSLASTSSSNRSLEVHFPASVTIENSTLVVLEARNVTLRCFPFGFPSPNISWIDFSNHTVQEGSILKLLNISRHQNGSYTCSAANACGSDRKKVEIIVEYPPEVNGSGQNATVAGGAEHTFFCPVDGSPVPSITWYSKSGAYSGKQFKTRQSGCYICIARNIHGISDNITQCLIINSSLPTVSPNTDQSQTMVSSITVSQSPSQTMVSSSTASQGLSSSSTTPPKAGPPWIIIIAVAGGVVLLVVLVGVLTWWVHKQRKCRKDSKIHNSDLGRHDDEMGHLQVQGAYAQSGPPAANGTDSAAEQEIGVAGAIPTYAVVDKSTKSKKQAEEKPPEYAVVDKSQKKEKQEVAAIPTYAAVDKSKKKKKSREEVPAVYAEVDKSKKKKKKKIDDKNLYENLDEPKKEKKPGELLYADLGDFQNPSMPAVSISPQPLPAIKKADPYERTDYADITQFLKGNATLPPNDGNGNAEMKPKRPSKKKEIQGNDKETPI